VTATADPGRCKGNRMTKLWISAVMIVGITAGLIFTAPGHRLLYALGWTAACSSDDCGGN